MSGKLINPLFCFFEKIIELVNIPTFVIDKLSVMQPIGEK